MVSLHKYSGLSTHTYPLTTTHTFSTSYIQIPTFVSITHTFITTFTQIPIPQNPQNTRLLSSTHTHLLTPHKPIRTKFPTHGSSFPTIHYTLPVPHTATHSHYSTQSSPHPPSYPHPSNHSHAFIMAPLLPTNTQTDSPISPRPPQSQWRGRSHTLPAHHNINPPSLYHNTSLRYPPPSTLP